MRRPADVGSLKYGIIPGVWSRRSWFVVALGVLTAALTSCGAGDSAPVRGFGARQFLMLRDPTVRLVGQLSESRFVYATTDNVAAGGETYWSVDTGHGQVENLGPAAPDLITQLGSIEGLTCRYDAGPTVGSMPTGTATITDRQSSVATVIDRITSFVGCPTVSSPELVVLRVDDAGDQHLWAGRYDQLILVPADLIIDAIVGGNAQTVDVLAASPAAPYANGIFSINVTTAGVSPLVTPNLDDVSWARGATPDGPLRSVSIDGGRPARIGDHYVYSRQMSDGSSVTFAGPFASGSRELALFRADATLHDIGVRFETRVPALSGGLALPQYSGVAWEEPRTMGGLVLTWNDDGALLASCAWPTTGELRGAAQPGGSVWAVFDSNPVDQYPIPGPLLLVLPDAADPAVPGSGCVTVAPQDVLSADFSPDGNLLSWLSTPATGNPELWVAAADGTTPRRIGAGAIDLFDRPRFTAATRMELNLGGDLVWLDVRDDPVQVHYIAEHAFGQGHSLSQAWLVSGYALDSQDGTGTLGVVNGDSGVKRPISESVAQYSFLIRQVTTDPLNVVFLVRGRTPSPQDGLWFATVNPAELN